jgi:hypothetical protein
MPPRFLQMENRGMSYDIELTDPVTGEVLEADEAHHMRGGTYAVGGTTRLELNITYNYAPYFVYAFASADGIRSIYAKTGAESIPIMEAAAALLGDDADVDYWRATEGNAKRAILQLLAMARMRPDGVWRGD